MFTHSFHNDHILIVVFGLGDLLAIIYTRHYCFVWPGTVCRRVPLEIMIYCCVFIFYFNYYYYFFVFCLFHYRRLRFRDDLKKARSTPSSSSLWIIDYRHGSTRNDSLKQINNAREEKKKNRPSVYREAMTTTRDGAVLLSLLLLNYIIFHVFFYFFFKFILRYFRFFASRAFFFF